MISQWKKARSIEKLIEMSRKNDYTTENLVDNLYQQKYYKLIDIDLSAQASRNIPQQINFTGKLKEDDGEKIF